VPYASLNYCALWKDKMKVIIEEIPEAEHRAILANVSFFRKFIEYVACKPATESLEQLERNIRYLMTHLDDQGETYEAPTDD